MLEISIALSVILCLRVILTPGKKSLLRAIHMTLILVSTIPSFAAPPTALAVAVLSMIVALSAALFKNHREFQMSAVNWGLVGLVLAVGFSGARGLPINIGGFNLAMAVSFALAALVFPLAARNFDTARLFSPLVFLLPVHAALGLLEQMSPGLAYWPRGTWLDEISNREQQLVPGLFPGRSMSLTGHPILLGFLGVLGVLIAFELRRRRRHTGYLLFVPIGAFVILLSGTRSAVAAGVVCLLVMFFLARKSRAAQVLFAVCVAGFIVISFQINIVSVFLNDSVQQTASYTHRTDIITNARRIFGNASDLERVIGVGEGNVATIFERSLTSVGDDYLFFDNQFVRLFAISGIVSLLLAMIALIVGFLRSDRTTGLILLFIAIMFLSFDTLTWLSGTMIFTLAAAGRGSRAYRTPRAKTPAPSMSPPVSQPTPTSVLP